MIIKNISINLLDFRVAYVFSSSQVTSLKASFAKIIDCVYFGVISEISNLCFAETMTAILYTFGFFYFY